ncbi:MAG: carboxypeptidase-like regulatory domain-containing protein, partial [Terriglobales bacterium]
MLSRPVSAAASHDGRMPAAFWLLFATFTLLLFALSAMAQTTGGRVLGTLTDQSGAAVAGATVIITDVQRGTMRTITTDES